MSKEDNIYFGESNINNNETINNSNNFLDIKNNESNIISQINEIDNNFIEDNTINLDNIHISQEDIKPKTEIDFNLESQKKEELKHYHINYRKIFIISFSIIFISSLTSIVLYFYNDYIINYPTTTNTQKNLITNSILKIKDTINIYTNKNHEANNDIQLDGNNGKENLKNLIDSEQNYIQKKEILGNSIKNLINTILTDHKTLEEMKKTITKNGFLPTSIGKTISEKQQIGSIQTSLLSLEAIKFSSAISVFSYLDTFIESLSKSINESKDYVQNNIQSIIERGEKDINLYITNCYLNPFETNYQCNIINDFDKYYNITNDKDFNLSFFKELMNYTDTKLEQTELPSFSITFQKFDQNKDEITFNIDINTFKQDEIELAKKGILSPHIFIFTNLINNLKQSKFIVGESISTKNLKIENKIISIGSTQFIINNSNKTFTLPIQKENEREIFDFIEIN